MVDGVGDQVAHDPLDPAYVGLGHEGAVVDDPDADPAGRGHGGRRVDHPVRHVAEVGVLELQHRCPGVEAADLQEVREQVLEPVQLGLQQLGGPRRDGVEAARASCSTSPAIRTVVSGVRSSWLTSETKVRWTRESSTSLRICDCSASAIWLNDVARRAMSSSPLTCIRSSSRPAAIRSATRRASLTGVIT